MENCNEHYTDDKTKLQACVIANDCYKFIMDLATNGVVITDALKYVQGRMEHLNIHEKRLLCDIQQRQEAAETETEEKEEGQTTNGVFNVRNHF